MLDAYFSIEMLNACSTTTVHTYMLINVMEILFKMGYRRAHPIVRYRAPILHNVPISIVFVL